MAEDDSKKTEDIEKQEDLALIREKFEKANEKSFSIIEDYISGGYERTLARLLVYLPKERRKKAIEKIEPPVRERVLEILREFSDKKNTDADVLCSAGTVLKNAGFYGKTASDEVTNGLDPISLMCIRDEIKSFFPENPLLAMNIEYYIIEFDIILYLDDRAIQKCLREIDETDLAKALKMTSSEVADKIYRNMSRRAAQMLREEIEFMGPVLTRNCYEAQKKFIDIVRRLEDAGEIVIARNLNDEFV